MMPCVNKVYCAQKIINYAASLLTAKYNLIITLSRLIHVHK